MLSLSLLVSCGASREPEPAVQTSGSALRVISDGGDRVSSLRATFVARIRSGDVAERVRGILLVSKPERFRLRLSSIFGFTILDYLSDAGAERLWLLSEDRVLVGEDISHSGLLSTDAVRWVFLRQGSRFKGCRQRGAGRDTLVECRDHQGRVAYRGYVENDTLLLVREEILGPDRPALRIAYSDHRATQGVRLPYRIEWTEDASGARVEIDIDRYEVDPRLSSEMFAPTGP